MLQLHRPSLSLFIVLLHLCFSLTLAVREITSKEFHDNIKKGVYDIVIDVRTQAEWNAGHIANATLVIDLAQGGDRHIPILGCQTSTCKIAVYCRSGARARAAAAFLESKGFPAPVDNGQGINQWIAAGYPVVNTPSSFPAKCSSTANYQCPTRGITVCFSGNTKVAIQNKGQVSMKDVRIGDHVLVQGIGAEETYEPVYDFGHYDPHSTATFLKLFPWGLEISSDHMIFVEGGHAVPVSTIQVGDRVMLPASTSGGGAKVEAVTMIQKNVVRQGVYAPFTTSGTIVVNGVVASTFIAFQNQEYLTIGGVTIGVTFQWMARTFQLIQLWFGRITKDSTVTTDPLVVQQKFSPQKDGMSLWVSLPFRFAQWWFQQHAIVMSIVAIPVLALLCCLSIMEGVSNLSGSFLAISSAALLIMIVGNSFHVVPNRHSNAKFMNKKKSP